MRIQIHYRNNHKTETFFCAMKFIDYLNKSHIARSKIFKYTYDFPCFDPPGVVVVPGIKLYKRKNNNKGK